MSLLNRFSPKFSPPTEKLTESEKFAVYYHNLFDYPLALSELIKWSSKKTLKIHTDVVYKNGFYFVKGREGLIYKRLVAERKSVKFMEIAFKTAKILKRIPFIKMVGITGSLAMNNVGKNGDVDLLIITKRGSLWISRITAYFLLKLLGFDLRSPKNNKENGKLCLNMWLDESDLSWPKNNRNFYTAHEILQIKPLFNKEKTFEKLIWKNKWVFEYWPNALKVKKITNNKSYSKLYKLDLVNRFVFWLQLLYMKPKITKEKVTITRAIFHPVDLSKKTLDKLKLS